MRKSIGVLGAVDGLEQRREDLVAVAEDVDVVALGGGDRRARPRGSAGTRVSSSVRAVVRRRSRAAQATVLGDAAMRRPTARGRARRGPPAPRPAGRRARPAPPRAAPPPRRRRRGRSRRAAPRTAGRRSRPAARRCRRRSCWPGAARPGRR